LQKVRPANGDTSFVHSRQSDSTLYLTVEVEDGLSSLSAVEEIKASDLDWLPIFISGRIVELQP
jgi:hypothetical protein